MLIDPGWPEETMHEEWPAVLGLRNRSFDFFLEIRKPIGVARFLVVVIFVTRNTTPVPVNPALSLRARGRD